MKLFLFPYKPGSQSAKNLGKALLIKRIKPEKSKFKADPNKIVINWGASTLPNFILGSKVLNDPEYVSLAANKLHFFERIKEWNEANEEEQVPVPKWYKTKEEIVETEEFKRGDAYFARTILTGHSGAGIEAFDRTSQAIPHAVLYTKYILKQEEYRVHVMGGESFYVQRKARKMGVPDDEVNWRIRNHANGFIYQKDNFELPENVKESALRAIKALDLDFGAVDIITTKNGKAFVLEVNTAPGMEEGSSTLEAYVKQFKKVLQ